MRGLPFECWVALRFLREGRFQTLLILGGIVIGVAVVVFITTTIEALQNDIIHRTLGTQAHIVARPPDAENLRLARAGAAPADVQKRAQREQTIDDWQRKLQAARAVPGVVAGAALATGPGFAVRGGLRKPVSLIGVELPDYLRIIPLDDKLVSGALRLPSGSVIIGSELALDLGVRVSDRIRLIADESAGQSFSIAGIVDFGAKEVNKRWVLLPLRTAQSLLHYQLDATELNLRVNALFDAERIAGEVAARTALQTDSWMQLNAQLLNALRSQNASSRLIRFSVLLSVALAIASVLVVAVVQKSAEIGVMRAFGVRAGSVVWVFLIQGMLMGLLGALGGAGLAALLVALFHTLAQRAGLNYPATGVEGAVVIQTALAAIAVGTLAALAPALRAARLDPVQAMRHG